MMDGVWLCFLFWLCVNIRCADFYLLMIKMQYYMRTRTCKFGSSCKYHHPRLAGGAATPVSLNYYGYPLRPVCYFCVCCIRLTVFSIQFIFLIVQFFYVNLNVINDNN